VNMKIDDWPMVGSAVFSPDRRYRYTLERMFTATPNRWYEYHAIFIMLNPSTADADVADPTVRRCITYAYDWECNGVTVLNLFALRSTNPRHLKIVDDPVGPGNDDAIRASLEELKADRPEPIVVCAWGEHGAYRYRGSAVLNIVREANLTPHYLKLNASGQPAHPLYLPKNLTPIPYV